MKNSKKLVIKELPLDVSFYFRISKVSKGRWIWSIGDKATNKIKICSSIPGEFYPTIEAAEKALIKWIINFVGIEINDSNDKN